MSETFDEFPLKVEPPEFKNDYYEPASNFVIEFGVGKDKGKITESYIDINADLGSTYELHVAVKVGKQWHEVPANAVRVKINGSYERGGFITALQHTGLLTLPFYGKMKTAEEHEEEWNRKHAIREQT
jgi:hypothetical protein